MNWGIAGGAVALGGGFAAANFFRFKRARERDDKRLEAKGELSRRGHFRGRADVELDAPALVRDQDHPTTATP
jgi:hypothetical protein